MKFAFVSHVLPPSWSGQAVVIYRLLKGLNPEDYCLVSQGDCDADASRDEYTQRLSAHHYQLPPTFESRRGFVNIPFNIFARARHIARIIRRERCEAVVACTGDFYYLPASYLASRLARVKFYPYIFDYYSQQWMETKPRRLAERFEPIMMKGAAGIIVPNEFMRDELKRRYRVEPTVIRNSCDLSLYESTNGSVVYHSGETRKDLKIVYTGAISAAQIDAIHNLIKAIDVLGRGEVTLHIYTAQPQSAVAEALNNSRVIFHDHEPIDRIPDIQKRADILFLPLSFNSPYPEVIKTSAPGKIGDYLASRQPILVHAPANTFVSSYFRDHECGLVVDENQPDKLADAIKRLTTDTGLRNKLSENAWERARVDFSNSVSQARFKALLELV